MAKQFFYHNQIPNGHIPQKENEPSPTEEKPVEDNSGEDEANHGSGAPGTWEDVDELLSDENQINRGQVKA